MPKITVIPATRDFHTGNLKTELRRKRVAAYARVSTNSEEQLTSYEAQVDYYTKYIQSRTDWEFIKIYTDEGISATNTKHREGFNEMIADALAGKIDLIITKSVSRFARNTVDSLTTVRKLRDKGIEVYFEKENIYTLDSKGELLITIMSSLAQEESRSISENVTWGKRKHFADGKVTMPYKHFLGYKKGENGLPEIIPEEAEVVRFIYRSFLEGKTSYMIAESLTAQGIKTPAKKDKWCAKVIESILRNEKYKGAALLQKSFTINFLEKKMKINEGEVPQYYIEESHPAIIDPYEYELVQMELDKRKSLGFSYSGNSVFASKVICGDCGSFYGIKVWHSNDKYRRTIYRCNKKYEGEHRCTTRITDENELKSGFITAVNALLIDKESVLDTCREIQVMLTDTTEIESEIQQQINEIEVIKGLLEKLIESNSQSEQKQEIFWEKYQALENHYNTAIEKCKDLERKKTEMRYKAESIGGFIFELREQEDFVAEFNEQLWAALIDYVVVGNDGYLYYKFKNAMEMKV